MPIPESIDREDLVEALKPLCDLLGTSANNFYARPGMTIGEDWITFVVPASHEKNPEGRANGLRASRVLPDHPHPQGGERGEHAEVAYMVSVEIVHPS